MNQFMMRLLLLTALGLGAAQAQADPIDFSYSWAVLPGPVHAAGTGSVTLAAVPGGTSSADLGSLTPAYIPGAELTTTSSADDTPDSFATSFQLKLTLVDTASTQTGDLTFNGSLAGTLTATSSTLTSTLQNPLTQQLTLGDYVYTVTLGPTLVNIPAPGVPAALIDARVTVAQAPDAPPVQETPEPGTLLLGATAVAGLAARRWWTK